MADFLLKACGFTRDIQNTKNYHFLFSMLYYILYIIHYILYIVFLYLLYVGDFTRSFGIPCRVYNTTRVQGGIGSDTPPYNKGGGGGGQMLTPFEMNLMM